MRYNLYHIRLRRVVLTEMLQANALAPNWGQTIFQSANEMFNNSKIRDQINESQGQLESEKQWWDKRREQIQSDFMKELDESEKSSTKNPSEDEAVLVDTPAKKAGKK